MTRTARFYTLGEPGPGLADVWFVCHGYGQLASRFLEKFGALDDGQRYVVGPEGLSRFYLSENPAERWVGASWMTREDRLSDIEDYVRYLDAVYTDVFATVDRARVRVHALGFSQGAATVSRWAALGKAEVDRLVLWGGEFPSDLDLTIADVRERLRGARVTLVHGGSDQFITPKVARMIIERLRSHDIPCVDLPFDGGHEISGAALARLAGAK